MGRAQPYLSYNSPLQYVADGSQTNSNTTQWRQLHVYLGAGADEKRYLTESKQMADALAKDKIPAVLDIVPGKHGWGLWNALFIDSLSRLSLPPTGQTQLPQTRP